MSALSVSNAPLSRTVPEQLMRFALDATTRPASEASSVSSRREASVSRTPAAPLSAATTDPAARKAPSTTVELSPEAQKVVEELKARDREVRAHEAAHAAVGGSLASAPSFSYQTGPDGKRYAVGGDVSIDVSRTGSPEEDIARAAVIRRAALAPAQPSGQDLAVAASASRMELEARAELAAQRREEASAAASQKGAAAYMSTPGASSGSLIDTRA